MATLYRYLKAESVSDNARSIKVAFSSEGPVLRTGDGFDAPQGEQYYEVLDHGEGNQDLTYLQNRGAVLDEHDPKQPIGVVKSAEINHDEKVGRAELEMDDGGLGAERNRQMRSGLRSHISFGYDQTKLLSTRKGKDGIPIKRFAWRAHEISSVAVPADLNVGVGRSFIPAETAKIDFSKFTDADIADLTLEQKTRMKILLDPKPAEGGNGSATIVIDESKVRSNALSDERKRVKEITTIAETLAKDHPHAAEKIRSITSEAIASESSIGDYQVRAMQEVLHAKPATTITMDDLGMDQTDKDSYSILRGIQSCLKRGSLQPDGLEGDVHKALVKRSGMSFEGFAVPHNAPVRLQRGLKRDLNATTFGQGGATVQTSIVTPIIEILRNRMVTASLGITVMGGLSGNVAIPRQTGAATAYALPESSTLTKSTQALDQILLAPHRVGAWNDYTRQLLLQSSIDVENFIRDDLMKVLAIKWDELILNGQGAGSEPLGVIQNPGVGSVVVTQGAPTYAQMVAFETALAVLNADNGNMAFATTPSVRGVLKVTAAVLTGATTVAAGPMSAIWQSESQGEGEVAGYRALASNQIPNNAIVFGNWSEIIHGLYGGYDVIVNPYSRDTDAAVRITINTFGDVALRHTASFAVSAGPAV